MNVSNVTRFTKVKEQYVRVLFTNYCMCLTQKQCVFSKLLTYLEYVFQSSQPYNAFGNTIVSSIVLTIIGFTDVTSIPPFTTLSKFHVTLYRHHAYSLLLITTSSTQYQVTVTITYINCFWSNFKYMPVCL